ncbi:MAG: helix-turn-helix domain-containing protein [Pseudomonadales bacterium]
MSADVAEGPGRRLRLAREGMEVSPGEVADALNLPIRVIEALEADDFELLPPTVFTRGYLRSYARLLELSPEELLALYPEAQQEAETADAQETARSLIEQPGVKLAGIVAAAVFVLIVVLVWVLSGDGSDEAVDETPPAEESSRIESTPGEVAPQEAVSGQVEHLDQTAIEPVADVARDIDFTQAASGSRDPEVNPTPAANLQSARTSLSTGARRITEICDELLQFSFTDECWVEVKSMAGDNLYSDLNRAGTTLTLQGRGPFRILLGYAPGVTLTFNGEPVMLAPHTRNNVANLVLGQ